MRQKSKRIGVLHCTTNFVGAHGYPEAETTDHCWKQIKMYDYVDGRLLVERESAIQFRPHKRFISVYTWGPLGLIARRGVSVRNGHWNADGGALCDPQQPAGPRHGAFVYDDPDAMQDYTYMADHMGNIAGLVDSATGEARRQVFDAFGVNVGGYITFQCAADHNWADQPWRIWCEHYETDLPPPPPPPDGPEQPCPASQPQPVERMQTGGFNWRGGEGSITDRSLEDMEDSTTWELRWSAYTRPSTGLIYMGARYYEPETGRFTQPDPVPYGMEVMWGQNNRWTYCGNDPVNMSDPTGRLVPFLFGFVAGMLFGLGFLLGSYYGISDPSLLAQIGLFFGGLAGATICTLTAERLAEIILVWSGTAFGVMFGLLAVSFLVGMAVGYFLGRMFALNPDNRDSPRPRPNDAESQTYYALRIQRCTCGAAHMLA